MSTQEYCGRHSIHYPGRTCPRCDAEERHREILNATEESIAETAHAMRESDYRQANPGDYQCPHCMYLSLRRGASRCPLCHGDVGSEYWNSVRASEAAAEERQRAMAAATAAAATAAKAEYDRAAPERAAAARRKEQEHVSAASMSGFWGGLLGAIAGLLVGGVLGLVVEIASCVKTGTEKGSGSGVVILIAMIVGAVIGFKTNYDSVMRNRKDK